MNKLLSLATVLISYSSIAQIFGPQQVLIGDLSSVEYVTAGDMDGNGFVDLIAAGVFDDRIVLIKNIDGTSFEPPETIVQNTTSRETLPIDIDMDGDLDLAYSIEGSMVKYKLNDGNGNFGPAFVIATMTLNVSDLKAVDIDNDGDEDILLGSAGVQSRWYENDGGTFINTHVISGPAGRSLEVGDLDNDGDMDIVSSASGSTTCVWYENDGTGVFSAPKTIRGAGSAGSSVFVIDVNGDGALDVLLSVNGQEQLSWFENEGGVDQFGSEQIITNDLDFAIRVHGADLDNDGDVDVIGSGASELVWFENLDGMGTFGNKNIISNQVEGAFSAIAVDLDNDGDLDVAATSRNNGTVAWWENLTILGVDGPKAMEFKIYPNPSSDYFIVRATKNAVKKYTLYDIQGKKLKEYPANTTYIDATGLKTGMYILGLTTYSGDVLYQKLIRE